MWQGWINFVLGIWLIVSGFVISLQGRVNMIIVGILAIVFGFLAFKAWQQIINGVLGIWVLVCGLFITSLAATDATNVNYIIVGIIMAILGIWSALSRPKETPTQTAQ